MGRSLPDRLSVVIPTFNRPELLARVMDGLAVQTWPRDRFEVIVVDDGGDLAAAPVVEAARGRGLPVVVERQANAGPAAARNRGIRRATGQVVVFLDDDCVPTTDWLEQHARGHAQTRLATLGPIVWHPDLPITPLLRYAGERALFDFKRISVADDAPFACFYTANAAVDRQLVIDAGLFDESFPRAAWEDTELAYRLRRAGARFVLRRDAIVQHLRGFDLAGFLQRQRAAGYESVRAWAKHPELRTLTGVDVIVGEEVEQRFFESAGRYAWLAGAAEALGSQGPGAAMLAMVSQTVGETSSLDDWRIDYIRQREASMNQELDRRQATINELFGTTDTLQRKLKRTEAALNELRKRHEDLTTAYQSQQAWALDMEERLKLLSGAPHRLGKLLGRIR
jgi:GT2 family glycosyltransferase